MSSAPTVKALIVCTDERTSELANVLKTEFEVYVFDTHRGAVRPLLTQAPSSTFSSVAREPLYFDVLFFHSGDRHLVPADLKCGHRFAFSAAGVAASPPTGSMPIIPIRRRFPLNGCPVRPRHLAELKSFLVGASDAEPPAFCRHDDGVPALWAMAILCKTYAAAGMAAGVEDIGREILGHKAVDILNTYPIYGEISEFWPKMQSKEWWETHLGFGSAFDASFREVKSREFLARILVELELDILAKSKLGVGPYEVLSGRSYDELLSFIGSNKAIFKGILRFLEATEISTSLVSNLYATLKSILEDR